MSQPWLKLLELPENAFPAEVFAYPEEQREDRYPIWYALITSPDQEFVATPLPSRPIRLKIVCANGTILRGDERR